MDEVKFNSLLDNEIANPKKSDFYTIDSKDDILGLTELVLNFDKQNMIDNITLHNRNFFNVQNMIISGRPCSTAPCNPHNKFCNSGSIPEIVSKNNIDNVSNKISENIDKDSALRNSNNSYSCRDTEQQLSMERLNKKNLYCGSTINPNFFQPTKRINLL